MTFLKKHTQKRSSWVNTVKVLETQIKLSNISPTIRAKHHGNIEFRRLSKENGGLHDEELKKV